MSHSNASYMMAETMFLLQRREMFFDTLVRAAVHTRCTFVFVISCEQTRTSLTGLVVDTLNCTKW